MIVLNKNIKSLLGEALDQCVTSRNAGITCTCRSAPVVHATCTFTELGGLATDQ